MMIPLWIMHSKAKFLFLKVEAELMVEEEVTKAMQKKEVVNTKKKKKEVTSKDLRKIRALTNLI